MTVQILLSFPFLLFILAVFGSDVGILLGWLFGLGLLMMFGWFD